jgi:hypothetical protein
VCTSSSLSFAQVTSVSDVSVTGLQNVWTASGRVLVSDVLVTPFRTTTMRTYKTWLNTVARALSIVGVQEETAHAVAHNAYAAYLQFFRQSKPAMLNGTSDTLYIAGIILAAAGIAKVAKTVLRVKEAVFFSSAALAAKGHGLSGNFVVAKPMSAPIPLPVLHPPPHRIFPC